MTRIKSAAVSRTGRRSNNEDAYVIDHDRELVVVADGMGGYAGGEVASRTAVEVIQHFIEQNSRDGSLTWPYKLDPSHSFDENMITVAIRLANRAIRAKCENHRSRMGTTVVVAAVRDEHVILAHVGDSRIYRLRDGDLQQMTRDHSFENEMRDAGVDPAGAGNRHIVTRALGVTAGNDVRPDISGADIAAGDRFLLCTDGLHDTVDAEELGRLLGDGPPAAAAEQLVDAAYQEGSKDNITAAVLDVMR